MQITKIILSFSCFPAPSTSRKGSKGNIQIVRYKKKLIIPES